MALVVRPEILTLTLASGETLIVKKRLNAGERFDMYEAMRAPNAAGLTTAFRFGLAHALAYLIDWTVKDEVSGEPLVIKDQPAAAIERTLRSLDSDDLNEIFDVIEAHDDRMLAERKEQKKIQRANRTSEPGSPSPVGSASATPTSTS